MSCFVEFAMPFEHSEDALWRSQAIFKDIDISSFDIFSFDLFETLFLRQAEGPDATFIEVGERAAQAGLLPSGVAATQFAVMRRHAEQQANAAHGPGIAKLRTIYDFFPEGFVNSSEVMQVEIDTERAGLVVNPFLKWFSDYLRVCGVTLIAVSDMYFSGSTISDLLEHVGFDRSHFVRLYVSSDRNAHKRDGGLFRLVLEDFPQIPPARICHIGDDPVADIAAPQRLGIKTVDYSVSPYLRSLVHREARLGCDPASKHPARARRLASRLCTAGDPGRPADERPDFRDGADREEVSNFWLRFGALVLGPVLVPYAAFVVEESRRLGIDRIAAFMREGRVLAWLMRLYAESKGYETRIDPLHVSRLALAKTQAPCLDRTDFFRMVRDRPYLKVGDLFGRAPGATPPRALADLADKPIEAIARLRLPDGLLAPEALSAWFASPDVATATAQATETARSLTLEYLDQSFRQDKRIALVDLGARATTAAAIHRLTKRHTRQYAFHAFLLYATEAVADAMAAGLPVSVFAGLDGAALETGRLLYRSPQPFERLLTGLDGCTLGYARAAEDAVGGVHPVIDPERASGWERRAILDAEQGIFQYWSSWSRAAAPEEIAPPDRLRPWAATLSIPTIEEARSLGLLRYDYNDGSALVRQICDQTALSAVRCVLDEDSGSLVARLRGVRPHLAPWPQGAATILNEGAIRRSYDAVAADPSHRSLCESLIRRLSGAGVVRVVLFGAGGDQGLGPAFLAAAAAAEIEVVAYVDLFPQAVDTVFHGVPVAAVETLTVSDPTPVALVTLGYQDAMRAALSGPTGHPTRPVFWLLG